MIQRDYLIVGAGIGGATVCKTLREHDAKGSVTLVGNESALPYHRPRLLESILTAKKADAAKAAALPEAWYARHKVELRLETLITQLNLERRLAVLNTGQVIEFRKACLAMGSRPRRPQVAGANLGGILYLRNLRDALALREMAATERSAVIIGGGLIAAEAASALHRLGLKVQILCRHPHLWQKWLDAETARWLTDTFSANGIEVLPETLNGFEGKTTVRNIQTKSGNRYSAGLVLIAGGVEPNLGLVANTPLGTPNGTPVNDYLETDEKGIYAVGDIALYPDAVFGGVRRSEHWESTLEQAQIAGANITGRKRQKYRAVPYHASTVLGYKFEFVGDFQQTPVRYEVEGDRAKGKFIARYYHGSRLMGLLLCNQPAAAAAKAKEALLKE